MGQISSRRSRLVRWAAAPVATLLLLSSLGEPSAYAQRGGGLGPGAREIIDNMSREERREFRSLSKRERRAHIQELMERRSSSDNQHQGGTVSKRARPNVVENSSSVEDIEGFVTVDEISDDVRLMVGKARRGNRAHAVEIQKARGGIETGLKPNFIDDADCPEIDSETWAIDYSHKRSWPAIHKGIDIPQSHGTPIRAIAAGTVVAKFRNENNRKGIEVMLRHTPTQTGLPFWTYSQYTHLLEMSPLSIGASVKMGQEIGKTSNTGKMGRRIRRDALHFAVLYSARPEWTNDGRFVAPKDGYWMDPNAFYRLTPPYDTQSLGKLPYEQKKIPVPYMRADGSFEPAETKRIWPYRCN